MDYFNKQNQKRAEWLSKLRWGWIIFVIIAIFISHYFFSINLPLLQLIILLLVLAIYNLSFVIFMNRISDKKFAKYSPLLIRSQLFMDFVLLALFLHYSGGIENPIAIYFIFHVIMSSFLLDKKYAYQHALTGVVLYVTLVLLEYFSIIPHYSIFKNFNQLVYTNSFYVLCTLIAFSSALFFAAFIGITISAEIKNKDKVLENTNKILQEQDKIKSEYVLMISHDLNEPAATVQNCLQLIQGGYCGECDPRITQTLQRAFKWNSKMISLLKDLASLSNLNVMVSLNLIPLCVNKTIDALLKEMNLNQNKKSIHINYIYHKRDLWIAADKEIFSHIITNIITNAIKYTPEHGTIGIELAEKKSLIRLEIWDTGIGIPKEYQNKVFQDFFRTPEAKEFEKDGTGLGLSIVKLGASLHKATIKIKSPHDKIENLKTGTCFILDFPILKNY